MTSVRGTFTDQRDGNVYPTVRLRDGRLWMAENLRFNATGSYPPDENPPNLALATHPYYAFRRYGRLYTFEAAQYAALLDGMCPAMRNGKCCSMPTADSRAEFTTKSSRPALTT